MNGNSEHGPHSHEHDILELGAAMRLRPLHCLAEIREAKGISLCEMARRLGVTVEQIHLEEEATDLSVSTLNRWAAALAVPVIDLIVEPEEWRDGNYLARSKAERLLRLATELRDHTRRRNIQRLAQTFVDQLIEIQPALNPPAHGQRHRKPSPGGHPPARRQGNGNGNGKPSRLFDPPSP